MGLLTEDSGVPAYKRAAPRRVGRQGRTPGAWAARGGAKRRRLDPIRRNSATHYGLLVAPMPLDTYGFRPGMARHNSGTLWTGLGVVVPYYRKAGGRRFDLVPDHAV